ncbi:LysE family transporter [Marinomonas sp. THO17]|uniref:LysE family translocator n=1 Tax=Marinomonas sp. THO17 TaxID=3149048 RepID=UPI00336BEB95
MLEILVFAFTIMYTPGPVNFIALFAGVNNQGWQAFRFCLGVGLAMFFLFLTLGYLGSELVTPTIQKIIAVSGGLYIAYLALKILYASRHFNLEAQDANRLNFKMGFVLQACNPKALVVIVPITTVLFPQANITGNAILIWSMILASMACGASSLYLLIGSKMKSVATAPKRMNWINRLMALLLLIVAVDFIF